MKGSVISCKGLQKKAVKALNENMSVIGTSGPLSGGGTIAGSVIECSRECIN